MKQIGYEIADINSISSLQADVDVLKEMLEFNINDWNREIKLFEDRIIVLKENK